MSSSGSTCNSLVPTSTASWIATRNYKADKECDVINNASSAVQDVRCGRHEGTRRISGGSSRILIRPVAFYLSIVSDDPYHDTNPVEIRTPWIRSETERVGNLWT